MRVLVIDPDRGRAACLASVLVKNGHQVVTLPTPQEFAVRGVAFGALVVDWDSPGIQIGPLGRVLRVAARGLPVGVLVLADDVSTVEAGRFADALVTDYQKKPADPEWIAKRLHFMERSIHRAAGTDRVTEQERLFRRTAESAPLALLALDASGTVKLSEGGALRKLGIPATGVIGRSIFQIYEDVGPIVDHCRRALLGETVRSRLAVDGRVLQTQYKPDVDENGGVIGVFAVSTDITEQYEVEENLRRSEGGFRSLIEQSSDGIAVHQDGVIFYANPALAAYLQLTSPTELLGRPASDLVTKGQREGFIESIAKIRAVGQRQAFGEATFGDESGNTMPVEVASVGVVFDGAPAVLSTFRDLSERKRLEEQKLMIAKVERERMVKELEIAQRIQTQLLPRSPSAKRLEIAARMIPATEIGGDYYEVIPRGDQAWIGIGDVAGHGLDAGLIMLMVQSTVSALVRRTGTSSPAEVLATVNEVIYENLRNRLSQQTFVTLTLFMHDGVGGFTFAGAHEDILILRAATGKCEAIPTPGPWMGLSNHVGRWLVESHFQLASGDTLLLYTDGVTEARDARLAQLGLEPLQTLLETRRDASVDALCDEVIAMTGRWTHEQEDDVTAMVIRYRDDG